MPNSSQFITAWFRKLLFLLLIFFLNPGIDLFRYFALGSGFILLLFVRQVLSPRRRRKWSPGPHRARHGYGCNKTLHKALNHPSSPLRHPGKRPPLSLRAGLWRVDRLAQRAALPAPRPASQPRPWGRPSSPSDLPI